jgi:hypothetical protein
MGGRSRCAGGDLKSTKAGLPYPKELIDGLLKLEEVNHGVVPGKLEKNMLYGLASTICLNLEQKELVTKHHQKDYCGGKMKVYK